jgi:hypothetical protein
MKGREHELATTCPHCGKRNELARNVTGARRPRMGDAVICITCGRWAIVDHAGALRLPTDIEAIALAADYHAGIVRKAWERMVAFAPTEGRA